MSVEAWIVEITYAESAISYIHGLAQKIRALYIPSEKLLMYKEHIIHDEVKKDEVNVLDKIEVDETLVEKAKKYLAIKKEVLEEFWRILDKFEEKEVKNEENEGKK